MLSPRVVRCHQGFAPTLRDGIPRFEGAARKAGAHAVAQCDADRRASRYCAKSTLRRKRRCRVSRIETPWERM